MAKSPISMGNKTFTDNSSIIKTRYNSPKPSRTMSSWTCSLKIRDSKFKGETARSKSWRTKFCPSNPGFKSRITLTISQPARTRTRSLSCREKIEDSTTSSWKRTMNFEIWMINSAKTNNSKTKNDSFHPSCSITSLKLWISVQSLKIYSRKWADFGMMSFCRTSSTDSNCRSSKRTGSTHS